MRVVLAQRVAGLNWFERWGLTVIVAVVIAILLTFVLQVFVRRFRRKLEGSPSLTQELNLQRIATLTAALSATGLVVIWVVTLLIVLEAVGVPLGALFASAGIAGVARGFDGTLHIVPNGNLMLVSNKSRGWARAIVDVRVAHGEDIDRLRSTLTSVFEEIRQDDLLRDWIHEGPSVLGIETLSDYAKVVRVVADTRPSKRWDVERALRERITRRLDAEGFRTPIPPTVPERPG